MKELENIESVRAELKKGKVENMAFQSVDLTGLANAVLNTEIRGCLFLGCNLTDEMHISLFKKNYIFPELNVPYSMYPNVLYNAKLLYGDISEYNSPIDSFDGKVYNHFLNTGKNSDDIAEKLARGLHDHSIYDALYDFLANYPERKVVAIMGGHGLKRNDESYALIAELSKSLTEKDFLMVSGGGPGAMEATHLGAWFAGKNNESLHKAIAQLKKHDDFMNIHWLTTAFNVMINNPQPQFNSLSIPTWMYGHEPSTPFATHIAKFFDNSIREDGLLSIAKGGIVFSPGSAGTFQEIFQEITQNHYLTLGYASPMLFLNKNFWIHEKPIYPLIEKLVSSHALLNLNIGIYDHVQEIENHLDWFSKLN